MHNNSGENEFNLHVNKSHFPAQEKRGSKTRFEKEANGNSEKGLLSN